jgi:hypothetical protein
MKKIIFILILLLPLFLTSCSNSNNYDAFAQCLTNSGFVMYGGFVCPHCLDVKEEFGDSFQYIVYIECDPRGPDSQSELCLERNVTYYPSFELGNGEILTGKRPFLEFSHKTNCPLPENGG